MGIYNPPKKRNMKLIALATICIVLAAGLVGVLALYLSKGSPTSDLQAQITQKDNTISALQSEVASLQSQLSQSANSSASQISTLNNQIAALNDQLEGYYNIATLNSSSILLYQQAVTQNANEITSVFSETIYYAGYVVIEATASANTTFVEVNYSYAGSDFNYNNTIGTSGSAVFPVLPGTLLINMGNTNQTDANSITVTATYYY
jgi:hypothetical protein